MTEQMIRIESNDSLELSADWLGLDSDEKITINCYLSPAICDPSNDELVPALWFKLKNDSSSETQKNAIRSNGVYIWLLKYGENRFRFIHVGRSCGISTDMMKRNRVHFNYAKDKTDCIVADNDAISAIFEEKYFNHQLECELSCPGRKKRKKGEKCKSDVSSVKKYLNNVHVLFLSKPFPSDEELKPLHCKTIHQLEGAILAAAIEYFKSDDFVLNTTGKAFNYHDAIKINYLAEIRKAINDCLVIFPDLTQSP